MADNNKTETVIPGFNTVEDFTKVCLILQVIIKHVPIKFCIILGRFQGINGSNKALKCSAYWRRLDFL